MQTLDRSVLAGLVSTLVVPATSAHAAVPCDSASVSGLRAPNGR